MVEYPCILGGDRAVTESFFAIASIGSSKTIGHIRTETESCRKKAQECIHH